MVGVQRLVERQDSYNLFQCFSLIPGTTYSEEFRDVGDERTLLGEGTFKWLVSIRPSHLVYRCGKDCYLEPYLSSRFARQFDYNQLYVGNPNPKLGCTKSLINGTRAWRYFITGYTGARFYLPHRTPTLFTTLSFCQWYIMSNTCPPMYKVNSSGVTLIAARLKRKAVEK